MWKNKFHIEAEKGLVNDPNGLIFWKGEYHVFYQLNPKSCEHTFKNWAHIKSKDLINWEKLPIALAPTDWFDKDGCYSGSAIEKDGKLYLMYTGNVKNNGVRESYQCLAVSEDGISFKKLGPVIHNNDIPKGYTRHFRDPKLLRKNGKFYVVLGAQRENLTGTILLYSSKDLFTWKFEQEIIKGEFGYMCECPDYYEVNKQGVLIFSPQGLTANGILYNNRYQSGYILRNIKETEKNNFIELDRGFEFYAPQSFIGKGGERIMFGWMGMPEELEHPSVEEGWIHSLTLPRIIEIENNKLYQRPHTNLQKLRKNKITIENLEVNGKVNLEKFNIKGITYEIILKLEELNSDLILNIRAGENNKTVLKYEYKNKLFILDREKSGRGYKGIRKCVLDTLKEIRIFSDTSSIEVYLNNGEEVFTANIYPEKDAENIILEGNNIKVEKIEFYEI
ncbi:sucrose-6-phosphate hydrolase [Fusobacterium perfoetens]|uniref:glycoside hydrolase family 32 protein n=1 Tax=Fusobacterium perfoetens TaxID=852 RepID=UPI001F453929|nr:sucrose-6-phosphate hydrolase [Fusobacterium perfoetens]MCF2626345.1 sucrose-6-phosphate hydrolase [Fusobacterium perfoetens]